MGTDNGGPSWRKRWWELGPYRPPVFPEQPHPVGFLWESAQRKKDTRPRVMGWPDPMTVDDALKFLAGFVYDDYPLNLRQQMLWREAVAVAFGMTGEEVGEVP